MNQARPRYRYHAAPSSRKARDSIADGAHFD